MGHALRDTARASCKKRESDVRSTDSQTNDSGGLYVDLMKSDEADFTTYIGRPLVQSYSQQHEGNDGYSSLIQSSRLVANGGSSTRTNEYVSIPADTVCSTDRMPMPLAFMPIVSIQENQAMLASEFADSMSVRPMSASKADSLGQPTNECGAQNLADSSKETPLEDNLSHDDFLNEIKSALAPVANKNRVSTVYDTMYASMGSLEMSGNDLSLADRPSKIFQRADLDYNAAIETMNASIMSMCLSVDSLNDGSSRFPDHCDTNTPDPYLRF